MQNKKLSWKKQLKNEIDNVVMQSYDFNDFLKKCKENNIEVVYNPKHKIDLKFKLKGMQKYARAKTLG